MCLISDLDHSITMITHFHIDISSSKCTPFFRGIGARVVVVIWSYDTVPCSVSAITSTFCPHQNGRYFADEIFEWIFLHQWKSMYFIQIYWGLLLSPIDPSLVQAMANRAMNMRQVLTLTHLGRDKMTTIMQMTILSPFLCENRSDFTEICL